VLHSSAAAAPFNMALDEALLEGMPRLGKPVLRFYSWKEPAASFGYFQRYAEVERLTSLRPLVRRPTAGGIVPHDADWTYSLVFPTSDPWFALKAVESYRRVHEWLAMAFQRLSLSTELASVARKAAAGQCFVGYERFDLLHNGRKLAGAAQRRTKDGLLIQGSLQASPGLPQRADWEQAMCDAARAEWGVTWLEFEPDGSVRARCEELVIKKYSQTTYNRKR
jgi:lipoate-protein ligase A